MIIDVHSHHFPNHIAPRAIAGLIANTNHTLTSVGDGTLTNQLDHMEHDGVDKAVLCQIATKPTQFEVLMRNARAIREGRLGERAQRMIIPFLSIHPADRAYKAHLEQVAAEGFKGVKLHPYYQNFSLSDPRAFPIFEVIASLGLVVECHCGYDVGYPGRYDACGPKDIATLLKHVPNLTFIAAHLGGCAGHPSHATDELRDLGCYIDTSALARNFHRDEEMRLLATWPTERILFATDFPWVSYAEAIRWVKSVRHPNDWAALFGGNAARLLL